MAKIVLGLGPGKRSWRFRYKTNVGDEGRRCSVLAEEQTQCGSRHTNRASLVRLLALVAPSAALLSKQLLWRATRRSFEWRSRACSRFRAHELFAVRCPDRATRRGARPQGHPSFAVTFTRARQRSRTSRTHHTNGSTRSPTRPHHPSSNRPSSFSGPLAPARHPRPLSPLFPLGCRSALG